MTAEPFQQHIAGDEKKKELISQRPITCPKAMLTQHHQICTPIQNVITVVSRVKTVLQMYGNHYLYVLP